MEGLVNTSLFSEKLFSFSRPRNNSSSCINDTPKFRFVASNFSLTHHVNASNFIQFIQYFLFLGKNIFVLIYHWFLGSLECKCGQSLQPLYYMCTCL